MTSQDLNRFQGARVKLHQHFFSIEPCPPGCMQQEIEYSEGLRITCPSVVRPEDNEKGFYMRLFMTLKFLCPKDRYTILLETSREI